MLIRFNNFDAFTKMRQSLDRLISLFMDNG